MSSLPSGFSTPQYGSAGEHGSPRPTLHIGLFLRRRKGIGVLAVALATGTISGALYPLGVRSLIAGGLAAILVVVSATDLERRVIPNRVVLPAIGAFLLLRLGDSPARFDEFLLAGLGAGAFFLAPNFVTPGAIGMGDVKLAVLLGVGLGRGVVAAAAVACLAILPFAAAALFRRTSGAAHPTLPFGPFLAFGGLVILILPRLLELGG